MNSLCINRSRFKGGLFKRAFVLWLMLVAPIAYGFPIKAPESVILGDVPPQGSKECSFELENVSTQTIILGDLRASCSCTRLTMDGSKVLRPKERRTVLATVEFGTALGGFETRILVNWEYLGGGKTVTMQVPIKGNVVGCGSASVANLDFGEVSWTEREREMSFIVSRGNASIKWDEIVARCPAEAISTAVSPRDLNKYVVNVKLTPKGLPFGQKNEIVEVSFLQEGMVVGNTVRVPVLARIVGPMSSVPSSIYLGVVEPNASVSKTLVIRSAGPDLQYAEVLSENTGITAKVLSRESRQLKLDVLADMKSVAARNSFKTTLAIVVKDTPFRLDVPILGFVKQGEGSSK